MNTPSPQGDPVNILLVDDRPNNLLSLRALLQRPDYNLVLAGSGREALALVLRQDFAVILLDVAMPRMDGFETAAIIKEREQSKLIPILFITASVYDMEHVFRGYNVGAVDYLRKPVDPHAVRAKVAVFVELYRQRKKIETQEDGIRSRDDFLAIAAHELRTPLTPLRLQAASLLRELDTERAMPREELLRRVGNLDRSARRLEALVERLLDEMQLSHGKLSLELQDVDLAALVKEAVARMKEEAERAGSVIVFAADQEVRGRWDSFRIDQVVSNLLGNAIKYGDRQPIEVRLTAQKGFARLSVRDHGRGIPEAAKARIFEKFERVSPLRNFNGADLGLWIVRRVVEAHGGRVTAWSEPNEGSEFVVELPVQAQVTEPVRTSHSSPLEVHP